VGDAQEIHTAAFILYQESSLMQPTYCNAYNFNLKRTNAICYMKQAETPSHHASLALLQA